MDRFYIRYRGCLYFVVCYNDRRSCKLDVDDLDNRNEGLYESKGRVIGRKL